MHKINIRRAMLRLLFLAKLLQTKSLSALFLFVLQTADSSGLLFFSINLIPSGFHGSIVVIPTLELSGIVLSDRAERRSPIIIIRHDKSIILLVFFGKAAQTGELIPLPMKH